MNPKQAFSVLAPCSGLQGFEPEACGELKMSPGWKSVRDPDAGLRLSFFLSSVSRLEGELEKQTNKLTFLFSEV